MLTIIGCGNPNRSDDGAGIAVARSLAEHPRVKCSPVARVFDAGTGGMDVMFHARGSRALVVVDACDSGAEPGAIFRLPGSEVGSIPDPSFTLHGFRWDHALYAGRKMFREAFPEDVTVYLIERESLELGIGLSARVRAAVERVTSALVEHVTALAIERPCVRIARGSFYLSAELYERYFQDLDSVAIANVEGRIALMPLRQRGGGGHLVKIRNKRGDRVVHAPEFLLEQRVPESEEHDVSAEWSDELAALVMPNPAEARGHGR